MTDLMENAVMAGAAIIVTVIMAVIGVGISDSMNQEQVFHVDNESEWNNYAASTSALNVTSDGYIQINSANNSASYTSVTLDANESEADVYGVYANVPQPDNSSVTLTVSGTDYNVSDGYNEFEVTADTSFSFDLARDSTSVSTPQVDYVTGSVSDGDTLNGFIATAAFALLIILVALAYFGRNGGVRGRQ